MSSQQSSFRGRRTAFTCQLAIAAIDRASTGPSKMPQPWIHAYSAPERLTPRRRIAFPCASTIRLPATCTAGAGLATANARAARMRAIGPQYRQPGRPLIYRPGGRALDDRRRALERLPDGLGGLVGARARLHAVGDRAGVRAAGADRACARRTGLA